MYTLSEHLRMLRIGHAMGPLPDITAGDYSKMVAETKVGEARERAWNAEWERIKRQERIKHDTRLLRSLLGTLR